ncbi:hypothetical protein LFU01_13780 [Lysinibacillus fusiformis]|nr:hypothetical protein LFU01_13780 [Lysinibacillus fusiformis]
MQSNFWNKSSFCDYINHFFVRSADNGSNELADRKINELSDNFCHRETFINTKCVVMNIHPETGLSRNTVYSIKRQLDVDSK